MHVGIQYQLRDCQNYCTFLPSFIDIDLTIFYGVILGHTLSSSEYDYFLINLQDKIDHTRSEFWLYETFSYKVCRQSSGLIQFLLHGRGDSTILVYKSETSPRHS